MLTGSVIKPTTHIGRNNKKKVSEINRIDFPISVVSGKRKQIYSQYSERIDLHKIKLNF